MKNLTNFLITRGLAVGLSLGLLALSSSSCNKNDAAAPTPAVSIPTTVKLSSSTTLGNFLTDAQGNTLYMLAADIDGANTCTGGCLPMWPVFYEANIQVPTGLKASDFATKTTPDGRLQTTFRGWPLYRFAPPVNGQNVPEAPGATGGSGFGGIWHVASPDYTLLLGKKTVTDKTTGQPVSKTYLTDAQGRTLYYFAKDNAQPNTQPTNCDGTCGSIWPALYLSAPVVPSSLATKDFATITRTASTTSGPYGSTTSSTQQLTYKGHPLYYYAADNATRGTVEGHDLSSFGDLWFVAAP